MTIGLKGDEKQPDEYTSSSRNWTRFLWISWIIKELRGKNDLYLFISDKDTREETRFLLSTLFINGRAFYQQIDYVTNPFSFFRRRMACNFSWTTSMILMLANKLLKVTLVERESIDFCFQRQRSKNVGMRKLLSLLQPSFNRCCCCKRKILLSTQKLRFNQSSLRM